jgi:hypothetical protein
MKASSSMAPVGRLLPRGASDAALAPYHVERSKLFVLDRLAGVEELDGERIARAIECTRFPYRSPPDECEIDEEGSLLRAAKTAKALGLTVPLTLQVAADRVIE